MLASEARIDTYKAELTHISRKINYNVCIGSLETTYWVCDTDDKLILYVISDLTSRGFVVKRLQNPHWWNGYAFKIKISW